MASEMVERVARVLEPQAWAALGSGDTLAYKNRRTSSLRKARAAIEAMREPTRGMKMAGAKAITLETMRANANYDAVCDAWPAMIDTTLSTEAEHE